MDDGNEVELRPGDVASIPPGRDAEVVGDKPCITRRPRRGRRRLRKAGLITSYSPECVGHGTPMETAIGIARGGGAVSRVGVPQHAEIPGSLPAFFGNITIGGGPAPVRAYMDELLPDILEGRIEPGRVFDRTVGLDGVPDGYDAMAGREAIKVMVRP